ncbi:hypothetical protein [Clostridium sp.]|uniref:hypothetical protein n=1 Tax=Clostridium sp. TaxID=1506 RepID=UPI003217AAE9
MKELTFREVIANIKEGEVWESSNKTIKYDDDYGRIVVNDYSHPKSDTFFFDDSIKYRLKREEVTFQEAFAAYEDGKEIGSIESKIKYKKIKNIDNFYSRGYNDFFQNFTLDISEIRGGWYIND